MDVGKINARRVWNPSGPSQGNHSKAPCPFHLGSFEFPTLPILLCFEQSLAHAGETTIVATYRGSLIHLLSLPNFSIITILLLLSNVQLSYNQISVPSISLTLTA